MNIRNLAAIREKDPKLYECLTDIISGMNNVAEQTNSNPNGAPQSPPAINALKVTAQNGHFSISITDQNPALSRGVEYFYEHADNPHFTNPQIVHIGTSRNATAFLGNVTRYFRAYSSYPWGSPSPPVYHGTQGQPLAVSGGGTNKGPAFLSSQGSGTGAQGQGLSGFGPVQKRPNQE